MKRIFIISAYPLFSQGVQILLSHDEALEFVGRETDVDRAVEAVQGLQPDVVMFDHQSSRCQSSPVMQRIMEARKGVKIIGLNLQNNTMCIYHQEQRIAREVEDLRRAIHDEWSESETTASAREQDQKGGD